MWKAAALSTILGFLAGPAAAQIVDVIVDPKEIPKQQSWGFRRIGAVGGGTNALVNPAGLDKGDKVAMWCIAGNRESRRDRGPGPFHHRPRPAASAFVVRVRHSPLRRQPEMQLTILWEEILKRFPPIEVVATTPQWRRSPTPKSPWRCGPSPLPDVVPCGRLALP